MGFDLVAVQDAITAHIEATLPNTPVHEDSIIDDTNLERSPQGQLIPYIVPRYGPLRRKYLGYSIVGARHDDYYATVDISAVAPKGRIARQIISIVTDALIGYKPDGTSEMIIEGGSSEFVVTNNEARPTAFVASVRFRFGVNQANVAEHLSPE